MESMTWIRQHIPISGSFSNYLVRSASHISENWHYIEEYKSFIKLDVILYGHISWYHNIPENDEYKHVHKTFNMEVINCITMDTENIYKRINPIVYIKWDPYYRGFISHPDYIYIPFESKEAALKWALSTGDWIRQ
jgi:hypothetical protein